MLKMAKPLAGKICLVTGATRGIGKGIALQLSAAGATVYITGRTLKKPKGRIGGSLEETVQEVESRGGRCIPIQCDHTDDAQIAAVFNRIKKESASRLDLLVNNAYSAVDMLMENGGLPFWEQSEGLWDEVHKVGFRNHYICTVHAARMMVPRNNGLIINVSSMGGLRYFLNIAYGVGKAGVDRMAADCAVELRDHNVAMISLWPGTATTEKINDLVEHSRDLVDKLPGMDKIAEAFEGGESPEYSGHCIVKLCQDPNLMKKSGKILLTSDLGEEYKISHIEGSPRFSARSVSWHMYHSGWPRTSKFIPSWIKVPLFVMHMMGSKF